MEKSDTMLSTQVKILESGKQYFLKHGFKDAPLRSIVKDAGFTLGAFYGYYKTKEDLFYALTDDVAQGFTDIILSIGEDMSKLPEGQRLFSMMDCYISRLWELVDYICANKTGIILLLNCSDGTKHENFTDKFRVQMGSRIFDAAKLSTTEKLEFDPILIEYLMRGYYDILSRIVVETDDRQNMYDMLRDVALVYKNGIISLMKGKS